MGEGLDFMALVPKRINTIKTCDATAADLANIVDSIMNICKSVAYNYMNSDVEFTLNTIINFRNDLCETIVKAYNGDIAINSCDINMTTFETYLVVVVRNIPTEATVNSYFDKHIFVINGRGGIGKDTLINSFAANVDYKVRNVSSITPVKMLASYITGVDIRSKDNKTRRLLSDLKAAVTEYNDLPTQYLLEDVVAFFENDEEKVEFIHIREWKEIQKFIDNMKLRYPINEYINGEGKRVRFTLSTLLCTSTADSNTEAYGNASDDDIYQYKHNYGHTFNIIYGQLEVSCSEFIMDINRWIEQFEDAASSKYTLNTIATSLHSDQDVILEVKNAPDTNYFPRVCMKIIDQPLEVTHDLFNAVEAHIQEMYNEIFSQDTSYSEKRAEFNKKMTDSMNEDYKDNDSFDFEINLIGPYVYVYNRKDNTDGSK